MGRAVKRGGGIEDENRRNRMVKGREGWSGRVMKRF